MKNSYAFRQAIHRPFFWLLITILAAFATGCQKKAPQPIDVGTPEALYGQLFYDVQKNPDIFSDSKTFADCVPRESPVLIRKAYQKLADKKDTKVLKQFVEKYFVIPTYQPVSAPDTLPIQGHIRHLWSVLLRQPDVAHSGTLIPLPHPYVVPGGRFREVYYWDSYFTMLGLAIDGKADIINDMVDNFAYLINTLGFIPNGNRTYYLTRSQPPFFASMVSLLAQLKGDSVYVHYLPYMLEEYNFWMHGADKVSADKPAVGHVVRMDDGTLLNRYYDKGDTPRSEAYREDVRTVRQALKINPALDTLKMYRDLRSTAESGWDFSSRWLKQSADGSFPLYTVHTTDIVPIDLNALMYNMEKTIAHAYSLKGDSVSSARFEQKAKKRLEAVSKYCWNPKKECYFDYDYTTGKQTGIVSLAGAYPLFFQMASAEQAAGVKRVVEDQLLKTGGVDTTPYETGQQWDSPNGWAPLQWITIKGLSNYGYTKLAGEIRNRWMRVNEHVYSHYHRMEEKYNVVNPEVPGGGGEYPNQDGFGWTNGVYQQLASEN